MTVKQRRACVYVLTGVALTVSLILWAEVVRSMLASVSGAALPLPSVAVPRKAPLLPSLHFAASSAARAAKERARDEMAQWEIREGYDLSIPSLSVRAPVFLPSARYWSTREWEALERQMQVGLLYGVVAYPHSVEPGERGTIIIAGHSSPPTDRAKESRYGEVFARIPDLKLHDQVVLRTASAAFTYEVTATEIVPAGDTTILTQQKGTHLLKLITCYPVGSVKERLIVAAELVGSE